MSSLPFCTFNTFKNVHKGSLHQEPCVATFAYCKSSGFNFTESVRKRRWIKRKLFFVSGGSRWGRTRQPAWSGLEGGEYVRKRAAHPASWTGSVNGLQSRYSTGQRYATSTNLEKKHGRQEKLCDERMIYAAQISRTDGLLANERAVSGCWGCAVKYTCCRCWGQEAEGCFSSLM